MTKLLPLIPAARHELFVVPVLDQWLVYAPLHRVAALVDARAAELLRSGTPAQARSSALDGLLDTIRSTPRIAQRPPEGEIAPSFLGIMPTRGCNLACVYCNFGGPTSPKVHMRPEIAVAAVDWMADRLLKSGRRMFQVHFFGGEPFISPEIVDIVTHRVRYHCQQHDWIPYLDASTNGVFNESRCEFIGDYFGGVVLSFDGPAEHHDRHRPAFQGRPSFDIVSRTAKRLGQMPLDLCLRVCITDDSVGEMEQITEWMVRDYAPSVINFESLTPGALAQQAGLKVPDPYRFARHCIGAYRVAERLGVRAVYSAGDVERARMSFCPVSTDAVIVAPDGRASACYLLPEDWEARGLDMDVGHVHADGQVDIDQEAVQRARNLPLHKPRCESCFCQWTCAGGCHVNQTYPAATRDYTEFCVQTRLITMCLLLRDLGCDDMVDALLADQAAMTAIAQHRWDPVAISLVSAAAGEVRTVEEAPPYWRKDDRPQSLIADGMSLLA